METFVVWVVVAAAAGYLLRRSVSVFKSREAGCGCSGCNDCGKGGLPASENHPERRAAADRHTDLGGG